LINPKPTAATAADRAGVDAMSIGGGTCTRDTDIKIPMIVAMLMMMVVIIAKKNMRIVESMTRDGWHEYVYEL
jgi:hypothetical protein